MCSLTRIFLPLAVTILTAAIACAGQLTGKVVRVADGDTITLLTPSKSQVKVRLAGIDAPESGQEFGSKSKEALAAMVAGKEVSVTEDGVDRYGRTIGWVKADDVEVNRRMIADGWAWHFLQYNKDAELARLQVAAKAAKKGLWAAPNPPMAPWDYRALQRNNGGNARTPVPSTRAPSSETAQPQGQYWINDNGVRHNSGCEWFGRTKRGNYGSSAEGRPCGKCGG